MSLSRCLRNHPPINSPLFRPSSARGGCLRGGGGGQDRCDVLDLLFLQLRFRSHSYSRTVSLRKGVQTFPSVRLRVRSRVHDDAYSRSTRGHRRRRRPVDEGVSFRTHLRVGSRQWSDTCGTPPTPSPPPLHRGTGTWCTVHVTSSPKVLSNLWTPGVPGGDTCRPQEGPSGPGSRR